MGQNNKITNKKQAGQTWHWPSFTVLRKKKKMPLKNVKYTVYIVSALFEFQCESITILKYIKKIFNVVSYKYINMVKKCFWKKSLILTKAIFIWVKKKQQLWNYVLIQYQLSIQIKCVSIWQKKIIQIRPFWRISTLPT